MKSQIHPPSDLSGLIYQVYDGCSGFDEILQCRWEGYKKYGFNSPKDCRDEFDPKAIHYFCRNCETGKIVGCLRMLSKLNGKLELENFVSISNWAANGVRPAELTRLSVPSNERSSAIKFGLWKLAWEDALKLGQTHFVVWTRKEVERNYEMLGFEYLFGRTKGFHHPLLGQHWHTIMVLDIILAKDEYRANRPELYCFFNETEHPQIILPPRDDHASG